MLRLIRHGARDVHWNWGYALSVPVAACLALTQSGGNAAQAQIAAAVAILLGLPWIVAAFIVVAVLSAPVYAWLHTLGPVPEVMNWLGGTVLIGAVIGCHINASLATTWLTRARPRDQAGLGDFLRRRRNGAAH
jgi:hypothetical protein